MKTAKFRSKIYISFILSLLFSLTYGNTYVVDSTGDTDNGLAYTASDGNNTLRKCIRLANANAGADIINFTAGGTGTITLTLALPQITDPVTIDGTTATGWASGSPVVDINGNGGNYSVLDISGAGSAGTVLKALIMRNIGNGWGLFIGNGTSGNTVKGCFIGTNAAGTAASSINYSGIEINNSTNNTIGGTGGASDRNLICGAKQNGILLTNPASGNVIQGNYIGLGKNGSTVIANGTTAVYNYGGIRSTTGCTNNTIGGSAAGAGNVISGNLEWGIWINGSTNFSIQGNIVGLDAVGTTAKANALYGIILANSSSGCTIGGDVVTNSNVRNIISGNTQHGVRIETTSTSNVVAGNYIGTDINGASAKSNGYAGVSVDNSNTNTIGGTTANYRNIIAGNTQQGIIIANNADNTLIQYNYIGVDKNGNTALANGRTAGSANNDGIYISTNCDNSSILDNIISGNGTAGGTLPSPYGADTWTGKGNGIAITGTSTNSIIRGNTIGLGADGSTAIRNNENGISVTSSNGTTIGGGTTTQKNIITNCPFHAIILYQSSSFDIKGNYIGTDATASLNRGNQDSGILTHESTSGTIGGTGANDGNIIVYGVESDEWAIRLQSSDNIVVKGNIIGTNSAGGTTRMGNQGGVYIIDYGATAESNYVGAGAAAVAAGEANTIAYNTTDGVRIDVSGGTTARYNRIRGNNIYCNGGKGISLLNSTNQGVAAPVVTSSATNSASGTSGANAVIHGYVNRQTGSGCDCEGEYYLGNTTADASGNWTLNHNAGLNAIDVVSVTATQTNTSFSTSEFYACTSPLPVALVSFNAFNINNEYARITWETASEINNSHFEIQKSLDAIIWKTFHTVKGAGNSNLKLYYETYDNEPVKGFNYYRIKQVDLDGTFKIYPYRALRFEKLHHHFSLSPNPTSDKINILPLNSKEKQEISFELLDVLGKIVLKYNWFHSGEAENIDTSALGKGCYFFRITQGNETESGKLVIK